jgi:proton-translocating NAD(P)+ transhydrogenase subunit alpha
MKAGVLKETWPGETRVAVVPGLLAALAKSGIEVLVEAGAGAAAGFPDAQYQEKGAALASRAEILAGASLLLSVRSFAGAHDAAAIARLEPRHVLVGFLDPLQRPDAVRQLAARGVTCFALELVPRISRAQSMDALSSTATMVGYKAVLLAANRLPRMMPMMMTAAGTIAPARVFVIGAGVAGLQAIATARRLGAVVEAYDVRPAVKEQIHSLGAKFVEMPLESGAAEDKGGYAKALGEEFYKKQRELMMSVVQRSDVVITTAAIPGKEAPVLVTKEMVAAMAPGSIIVDLAAATGGNCELTRADQVVVEHGVTIMGPTNLPATVPNHASQMFAKNVATFLALLVKDGKLNLDMEDQIIRETLVTRGKEVVLPRVKEALGMSTAKGGAA